jgi:hypothetical protein
MLHSRTERRILLALVFVSLCLSLPGWAQKPDASKAGSPLATAKAQLGRGDLDSAASVGRAEV